MKKLISILMTLVPFAAMAVDFETVTATVDTIVVTSSELSGNDAWRQSSVTFVEGNPTIALCGGRYAFDEKNASLTELLTRNKDAGVPRRMVFEIAPPGGGITCFVRRVTEL